MPAVSVLMPVYNSDAYLREAMDSILKQRFSDFEFLIFNDGSTDNSSEIINSYRDDRIRLFEFQNNEGYVPLLNLGLREARGQYIARMDADDVSHPERLGSQFNFLEQHKDYVICGSRYSVIGSTQEQLLPLTDEEIKLRMLYITPFCHPTVMMRQSVLGKNKISYQKEYAPAEDYDLWVTLSDKGKFYNLKESLLSYRIHDQNISLKKRTEAQDQNLMEAQTRYISKFFDSADIQASDIILLHKLFYHRSAFDFDTLSEIGSLLEVIMSKDCSYPVPFRHVHDLLSHRFFYCCTTSTGLGTKVFRLMNRYSFINSSYVDRTKLLIKSILKYKRGA
ncbi:MAG: glycosyltransferase family 2 protein [Bacteroidota bacterium]